MNRTYRLSLLALAPLLVAGVALISLFSFARADTYKQAFSTNMNSSTSALFKVAGDESSIMYGLSSANGELQCYAQGGPSMGSWVTVATLPSSMGSITGANIMNAGMYCNPGISSVSHLVQAMREGSIKLLMGGSLVSLNSGDTSAAFPIMTGTSGSTATSSMSTSTSMGSTGTATATSTDSMGSTTSTTGSSTSTTTATFSASDLRVALNNLLREHVSSSIAVLHDIIASSSALSGSLQEQDQNAVDLASDIGLIYGPSAGDTFLKLFRAHITDSNAYTMGIKNMSVTDQQTALANLDTQLQQLSSFFATANPYISYDGLLAALRQHEIFVNKSSEMYAAGNYSSAYDYERQALAQISGGADGLSAAIVLQYPSLFTQ